jgi:phospholipid/cholesterol/gamma-HCH transport system ATP-binding protein
MEDPGTIRQIETPGRSGKQTSLPFGATANRRTIAADREYEPGLCHLSLSLGAGDLAVVLLEKDQVRIPLADAAEGLVTPVQGTVTFLGEDWQTMTPDRAAAQRGKIGRVFEGESWLSGLNVDQNITLAQRHHTRRSVEEIEEEATHLCQVFGLPGLPRSGPSNTRWQDLHKAACVRAFLGAPILILLENPTSGVYADVIAPLIDTVREDSSAVVKKQFGVAGDAYFEITRGEGPSLAKKNASIVCKGLAGTRETAMEEVRSAVLPVLEKISVGVDTWTTLGTKLSAGADAWTGLGTNLGETRQQLSQLIARLVASGKKPGRVTPYRPRADAGRMVTR